MSERPRVFGMVNMQLSWEYTSYALKTFAKYTNFSEQDLFLLVDDDGSFGMAPDWILPHVQVITNTSSKSLAQNMNAVMRVASEHSADFYFFHNDIIFTDLWSDAFRADRLSILVPLSNQDIQYQVADFTWKEQLILTDYTRRAPFLRDVVKLHRTHMQGYRAVLSAPFHSVKIPLEVYRTVGEFDESYPRVGGEDFDYCLRAIEAGFKVEQVLSSYLLHLGSQSTLGGGEVIAAERDRIACYAAIFEKRWGLKLRRLVLEKDLNILQSSPEIMEVMKSGDFRNLLELLK